MRHDQMLVDEKLERLRIRLGQPQQVSRFLGDFSADFAMVADIAFAQIVDEQGEVEQIFGAVDNPRFGILKLKPYQLEVSMAASFS